MVTEIVTLFSHMQVGHKYKMFKEVGGLKPIVGVLLDRQERECASDDVAHGI